MTIQQMAVINGLKTRLVLSSVSQAMVVALIDTMSDLERSEVCQALPDNTPAPRNLYYNYKTQKWIKCI